MPAVRKPTEVLERAGAFKINPSRGRARADEPKPEGELGDPPDHLAKDVKVAWRYLAALLPAGVAKDMDRAAMEEMAMLRVICQSSRATAAERVLYKNYLSLFGMTPADRSRVKIKPKSAEKSDPLAEFLATPKVQ